MLLGHFAEFREQLGQVALEVAGRRRRRGFSVKRRLDGPRAD
jgi:hypothetical protein